MRRSAGDGRLCCLAAATPTHRADLCRPIGGDSLVGNSEEGHDTEVEIECCIVGRRQNVHGLLRVCVERFPAELLAPG